MLVSCDGPPSSDTLPVIHWSLRRDAIDTGFYHRHSLCKTAQTPSSVRGTSTNTRSSTHRRTPMNTRIRTHTHTRTRTHQHPCAHEHQSTYQKTSVHGHMCTRACEKHTQAHAHTNIHKHALSVERPVLWEKVGGEACSETEERDEGQGKRVPSETRSTATDAAPRVNQATSTFHVGSVQAPKNAKIAGAVWGRQRNTDKGLGPGSSVRGAGGGRKGGGKKKKERRGEERRGGEGRGGGGGGQSLPLG